MLEGQKVHFADLNSSNKFDSHCSHPRCPMVKTNALWRVHLCYLSSISFETVQVRYGSPGSLMRYD